mmetsp:Transcript_93865/g.195822  ORF Transcript_93865/g.195822 Transcript_93865/m.195822 type:complete len:429 (+) Transcript_93865:95-1381(+)|eukprot:CAMPEP_0206442586 /NCGR_PEP_ID=MMETSP0324_2-20121206/13903_1 /ASSEMBLY_ACC=CAM_ASM_000836 /TAXON_ID=2866 /ORGANISM="Crypthecodinium cohnii, Strain Seligo" /LENGTH=428 /DNA_ID=CAMNT_0053910443 /DNA_START=76 /DNA_END=1362 /DNA_ORIENTATION=-
MERVQRIAGHIFGSFMSANGSLSAAPTSTLMSSSQPADDDVVICWSKRTAVGKAGKGSFKDTPAEDLLAALFKAVVKDTKIDANKIGDCVIGNVLQPTAGAATTRMAMFLGDLPKEVPCAAVNRQCSSSLQAMATVAAAIKTGSIDCGLAGGVESMSMYKITSGVDEKKLSPAVAKNDLAAACLISMGITSENVAAKYNISRETQDAMAANSHAKALAAQKQGLFDSEILPVTTTIKDKAGNRKPVTVTKDEGPREGTTVEGLAKLKAAFKQGGSTTAGNASQVSDGASLCLMARRSVAKEMGLPIVARFRSFAVVGVDPNLMGIGPAFAIPKALEKAGLKVPDIDIWEINEAFASQATMSIQTLGIDASKVNPKGGAIALGHPLGCTGGRQLATLLPELKRQGKKLGVISMCIGSGMGAASVIESEQ